MSDSKKIKLFYSNHGNNFGDCLSPLICEKLCDQKVLFYPAKKSNFFAIGSILHRLKNEFWRLRKDIWGSGHITEIERYKSPHNFHAIRGKKSAYLLKNSDPKALGDPGLLVDLIFPDFHQIRKTHRVGVIPHHVDQKDRQLLSVLNKNSDLLFIDINTEPLEFLRILAGCETILSSSLHGLIAADSFGIPNSWLKISDNLIGGNFKFSDYYSVFDIKPKPIYLNSISKDIHLQINDSFHRPGIGKIKLDLIKSFPTKFKVE